MSTHAAEKVGPFDRLINFATFNWLGVRIWIILFLATHFYTFSRIVGAEHRHEVAGITDFIPAIIIGKLGFARTLREENKHHPNSWMTVGMLGYWFSIIILWLIAHGNGGEPAGILWMPVMALLATAFIKGGGGHH